MVKVMLLEFVLSALVVSCLACPPWTYSNGDGECQCGDALGGVVFCDSNTHNVSVLYCNCMTKSKSNQTTVGKCLAMCRLDNDFICSLGNKLMTNDTEKLNILSCNEVKRTGQLCGDCIEGYGPPVYSYLLQCVQCNETNFKYNVLKYIATAFLPLSFFYIFVILFKISVTSGSMIPYVLICQVYTIPSVMKAVTKPDNETGFGIKILIAFFSVWNLDIFRSVYTPFCLHPKLNTMQVIALDYLVAMYPMFLIILTYAIVALHDSYPLCSIHCKPDSNIWTYVGVKWDIRGSLIQAFATFLVLTYVKILNISFDLLTPVHVYLMDGSYSLYLFIDGEIPYFGKEHLPYGVLALLMLTVFNIMPVLLLLVYPCQYFQSMCNSNVLNTFMDAFQGCYHHHPRDCRYFSVVHFIFRILQLLIIANTSNPTLIPLTGLSFLVLMASVNAVKPYKKMAHNKAGVGLYFLSALFYLTTFTFLNIKVYEPQADHYKGMILVPSVILLIVIIYGIVALISFMLSEKLKRKLFGACSHLFLLVWSS